MELLLGWLAIAVVFITYEMNTRDTASNNAAHTHTDELGSGNIRIHPRILKLWGSYSDIYARVVRMLH